MPKIPTYESQQNIRPTTAAPMMNEAVAATQPMIDLSNTINSVVQQMSDANDVMQATNAKASQALTVLEIENEASMDTGLQEDKNGKVTFKDNSALYAKRILDAEKASLDNISNKQVANQLKADFNLKSQISSIKVASNFKEKQLLFNRSQVAVVLRDSLNGQFDPNATPEQKNKSKADNSLWKRAQILSGVMDEQEIKDEEEKVFKNVALSYAETDPTYALQMVEEYAKENEIDKVGLVNDIKSIASINAKKEDIAMLQLYQTNQKDFIDRESTMSFEEKLNSLNSGIEYGMDKDWAIQKRAALLSTNGIDAKTQTEYFYDIVKSINNASANYAINEDEKSSKEFLQATLKAQIKIEEGIAKGLLDEADRKFLYNRIYTKDAAKAEGDYDDDLAYATSYFEKTLPEKYVPDALRKYIAVTDTADPEQHDYENTVRIVSQNVMRSIDPTKSYNDFLDKDKNLIKVKVGSYRRNKKTNKIEVLNKDFQWIEK